MTTANGRWVSVPTPVASAAGSRPERRDESGHHDRAQPQDRGFADGGGERRSREAQLVDVGDVDERRLHRDAEQGEEADPGRHREGVAGQPQRQDSADRRRHQHADQARSPGI